MCEFCTEHGEGKAWYLALKNYSQDLLSQDGRREHIRAFFTDFEARTARSLPMLDAVQAMPFVPEIVTRRVVANQKKTHFGQVVPLQDVDLILDQMSSAVRMPCVCRSMTTGSRQMRYCYGLNLDPDAILGDLPDYGEHLEYLSVEEARAAIHKLDKEGLVHSVWTFDTPFIGGLCNCDQDCMAYRMQIGAGITQTFFPAEYTALIDWEACSGCKLCRSACPFGAVRYSASDDRCLVDPNLCYGCGVCMTTCKRDAIQLVPRQRLIEWRRRQPNPGAHHVHVSACTDPLDCLACLKACPAQVFVVAPQKGRTTGVRAADWRVHAVLESRCTGCNACVEACPQGVIEVH